MNEPTVFNNRYQLLAEIGQGGLAEVYRAQDVALGRLVAVKALRREYVVDPAFLVRFHREAQSAARLTHPNIVAVYDFGQDQGRPYIVMEYVSGLDLRTMLQESARLPVNQAVDICIQVCAGVGYAHRSGLVHGDLKPGNVLIGADSLAKVVDFGLARALGESAMDEEGELVWGTPAYFAPEQAAGGKVMPATDVYAIGVILYEMLAGQLPFTGSDTEVAQQHLYAEPAPVDKVNPRIPPQLALIVARALQKQPEQRFATAAELGRALFTFRQAADQDTGSYEPALAPQTRLEHPDDARSAAVPVSSAGIDWWALSLGVLVVIAVLGLVPLWVGVYHAYVRPAPASAPTPTTTVPPGQVRVPDLVGMEVEAGRRTLEALGLQLEVTGRATHPSIPAFAIIEQAAPAGAVVPSGTAIRVIISQGPQLVEVPFLAGKTLGEAQSEAQANELLVETHQAWSDRLPGTVVDQDPPPGSLVQSRSLVRLTVSSGTQVPVGARLGDTILLVSYELPSLIYRPGDSLSLTLAWQAIRPPGHAYSVGVYLSRADGSLITQQSGTPAQGSRATDTWAPGSPVIDNHQLDVPSDTPAGEYWLRVAMLNGGMRLPVTDAGEGKSVDGDLVLLAIQVK